MGGPTGIGAAVGVTGAAVGVIGADVGATGAAVGVTGADVGTMGAAVGVMGAAVGMMGAAVGVTGAAVGVTGAAVGMTGAAVGMTGAAVGMTGAAVGMTGAAVGMTGVGLELGNAEGISTRMVGAFDNTVDGDSDGFNDTVAAGDELGDADGTAVTLGDVGLVDGTAVTLGDVGLVDGTAVTLGDVGLVDGEVLGPDVGGDVSCAVGASDGAEVASTGAAVGVIGVGFELGNAVGISTRTVGAFEDTAEGNEVGESDGMSDGTAVESGEVGLADREILGVDVSGDIGCADGVSDGRISTGELLGISLSMSTGAEVGELLGISVRMSAGAEVGASVSGGLGILVLCDDVGEEVGAVVGTLVISSMREFQYCPASPPAFSLASLVCM
jgi:hypothetical protein